MFEVNNGIIKITKGDSASIAVTLVNTDGTDYEMQSGDTLTMTVRKSVGSAVLFQVTSTEPLIVLTPEETKNLIVGNCAYDIELATADGGVYTIVGVTSYLSSNMIVYGEITE